jgi:hypothetical protein
VRILTLSLSLSLSLSACGTTPEATGACCLPDGSCTQTTATACSHSNGSHQGVASDCADACAGVQFEACCNEAWQCTEVPVGNCGFGLGPGTHCPVDSCLRLSTCCTEGSCSITLGAECTGTVLGELQSCSPNPC